MWLPKYLKFLVKGTNTPFTMIFSVSFHLVYSSSSCVHICFSFSFLWTSRAELVGSVMGEVHVLKKTGGGNNMHSVSEGFFPVTMCISRPNQAKWLERKAIPLPVSVLDSNTNAAQYT